MDRLFTMMSEDPRMGPALRDADVPQRFEFEDLDLVMNIRARRPGDAPAGEANAGEANAGDASAGEAPNLHWEWTDEVDWKPRVRMKMSSEIANRYFQGRENIPLAIARRRIKTGGDIKASLALIPITKPVYERYRSMLAEQYPHLVV
jgi:hypothetical protein